NPFSIKKSIDSFLPNSTFTEVFRVNQDGSVYATKFVPTGGTIGHYLNGDGSLDPTSYIPTTHAASGITSTLISNWNTPASNNHTHGNKTFLDGITSGAYVPIISTSIRSIDNRATPTVPTGYETGLHTEFKNADVTNLPEGGYAGLLTFRKYGTSLGDLSG